MNKVLIIIFLSCVFMRAQAQDDGFSPTPKLDSQDISRLFKCDKRDTGRKDKSLQVEESFTYMNETTVLNVYFNGFLIQKTLGYGSNYIFNNHRTAIATINENHIAFYEVSLFKWHAHILALLSTFIVFLFNQGKSRRTAFIYVLNTILVILLTNNLYATVVISGASSLLFFFRRASIISVFVLGLLLWMTTTIVCGLSAQSGFFSDSDIKAVVFSHNDRFIAFRSDREMALTLWDVSSGKEIAAAARLGHGRVCFSENDQYLAVLRGGEIADIVEITP